MLLKILKGRSELKVIKRNGKSELYNCKKIKKAISFACEGLNVNPLKLEAKFDEFLFDGVSTESIQQNLIIHAKNLATPSDDQWVFVAGRLATMDLWNRTKAYEKTFPVFLKEMIIKGVYKHEGLLKYTDDEILEISKLIDKNYDLNHSISSVTTFRDKYLVDGEVIQFVTMVDTMIYASVESEENRLEYIKDWYESFAKRKLSKATPHWTGLRFGGNTGSCFVLEVGDSIESIMDNASRTAKISKDGGGVGTFWGRVRAKGDMIAGEYGLSGGVLPMMKIYNDSIVAFNQRGKRKGAITIALPFWHKDIEDFLEAKSEVGDLRTKLFDSQPQVVIPDLFMKMKEQDKNQIWYTFSPHEVEVKLGFNLNDFHGEEFEDKYHECVLAYKEGKIRVVGEIAVIELWKQFLSQAIEKGVPYAIFGDTLQGENPNKHEGKIHSLNLCVESSSNFSADKYAHTCSLMSVVVGRMDSPEDVIKTARQATRILANTLSLTKSPVDISDNHIDRYRTIGVGIQGLVDYLAKNDYLYSDVDKIKELAELIQWGCVLESMEMAKEFEAYPAFEGSRWSTGEQFDNYIKESVSDLTDWEWLKGEVMKWGVFCSQHTSPAPNTSTSIAMDAQAGVMPPYAEFFFEDNKNGKLPVTSMYLSSNPLTYLQSIGMYDQIELTKMVGSLQTFVDTSISAEYAIDKNYRKITAKYVSDIYDNAWKNGTKAVYYLRTIKEGEQVVEKSEDCVACAG